MFQRRVPELAPDYQYFHFGLGRQQFRGPKPDFADAYIAYLGGSETFGKAVQDPYPQLLAERTNLPAVNFARQCGGVDLAFHDPLVLTACSNALATVLCVTGASNLSNRLYKVHPRRNDRFIAPTEILRKLYPQVDFTRIHFTRHLLTTLFEADPDQFDVVLSEIKIAWLARMRELTNRISSDIVLLWLATAPPRDILQEITAEDFQSDPMLVDQEMMDSLTPEVSGVIECVVAPPNPTSSIIRGPNFHQCAADALLPRLEKCLLK
jgi:hypothetical protein